jgi:hypothetical protein
MKRNTTTLVLTMAAGMVMANTAPAPVIESCAMRPGTTLMEVTYRVNDPDDVQVSAFPLAFVDGVRSFAKVMRPTTFVEGTGANLGTNVAANVSHQLVWDVGADWDIELGNIKFEIICKDARGLLPLEWLAIPATATTEALTISQNAPADTEVLNALFYQYAMGDTGLNVATNGVVRGSATSGVFSGAELVNGTTLKTYAAPYVMRRMNLQPADQSDVNFAVLARSGILSTNAWHALNKAYTGIPVMMLWGNTGAGLSIIPVGLVNVVSAVSGGSHCLVLKSDGTLAMWGANEFGECNIPSSATNVIAVAGGNTHSLSLRSDGTVVAWGYTGEARCVVPVGLTNGVKLGTGSDTGHNLVIKGDGTIASWGYNAQGQCNIPPSLSNTVVTAVAMGVYHSLALKADGTVVAWGWNGDGQCNVPAGLTNVVAIAAGKQYSMALRGDGTVVAWGYNVQGQCNVPAALSNVVAIGAGTEHGLALKGDGTVVMWGGNSYGQCNMPLGLSNVKTIATGVYHNFVLSTESEAN